MDSKVPTFIVQQLEYVRSPGRTRSPLGRCLPLNVAMGEGSFNEYNVGTWCCQCHTDFNRTSQITIVYRHVPAS